MCIGGNQLNNEILGEGGKRMCETRNSSLSGKITILVVICCCSLSAQGIQLCNIIDGEAT